jgi:hypothetical protein
MTSDAPGYLQQDRLPHASHGHAVQADSGANARQLPAAQTWSASQTIPHPPQLAGSCAVSTQSPAHTSVPDGQVDPQLPPAQRLRPPHELLQPLQFSELVCVSTQSAPQSVRPGRQTQALAEHHSSAAQVAPHALQLPGSTAGSTQAPSHDTQGAGHAPSSGKTTSSDPESESASPPPSSCVTSPSASASGASGAASSPPEPQAASIARARIAGTDGIRAPIVRLPTG